jgi:hypothetical protein
MIKGRHIYIYILYKFRVQSRPFISFTINDKRKKQKYKLYKFTVNSLPFIAFIINSVSL